MAEHTPTPWMFSGKVTPVRGGEGDRVDHLWCGAIEIPRSGKYRGSIASIQSADQIHGISCDEAEANAAFIVKAVNEYADAEKALLELCSRHGYATGHGDTLADIIREIDGQIPGVCVGTLNK